MEEKMGEANKEKHSHDAFSGITGGLVLILLGTLFLLATLDCISWGNWWAYFLLGLGVILIVDVVIRVANQTHRQHTSGKVIGGIVLIIIGASNIFGMLTWWPLILIAIGIVILISSLRKVT